MSDSQGLGLWGLEFRDSGLYGFEVPGETNSALDLNSLVDGCEVFLGSLQGSTAPSREENSKGLGVEEFKAYPKP